MFVTEDIRYIGVNDHIVDLFEGQYVVPKGMCYNSYVIRDEKIAVMDTVDQNFTHEWLDNLQNALEGRKPATWWCSTWSLTTLPILLTLCLSIPRPLLWPLPRPLP